MCAKKSSYISKQWQLCFPSYPRFQDRSLHTFTYNRDSASLPVSVLKDSDIRISNTALLTLFMALALKPPVKAYYQNLRDLTVPIFVNMQLQIYICGIFGRFAYIS